MKQTVVLFSGVGVGHLTPMVELAKLLFNDNFSVTIVIVEPPIEPSSAIASFISRVSSAHPFISFHRLPKTPIPPRTKSDTHPFIPMLDLLRSSAPHLKDFLQALSQKADVRALVLDFFCTDGLDAAAELGIPSYIFFSTGASNLATILSIPAILSKTTDQSFKDLGDKPIDDIPGVPPIPASHMPGPLQDRNSEVYGALMSRLERMVEADGIMVNTFEPLERRAVQALKDGLCVPRGQRMPPIYCIGPLTGDGRSDVGEERHECLKWLDEQPKGSVVFLCFGSMGSFSAEQLKEIAVGLERSGQRFLWVVRSPQMPEGFLERSKERGMVVKSWAPQTAVLGHEAVGAFVSHCGWNSTLEAVSAGVPMIAWPLYAEQKMNKVFLVEVAKVAVEMKGYDEELVTAEEVERKVRWVMGSEGGRELRNRAAVMKQSAMDGWKDGGSSARAWTELVSALKKASAYA